MVIRYNDDGPYTYMVSRSIKRALLAIIDREYTHSFWPGTGTGSEWHVLPKFMNDCGVALHGPRTVGPCCSANRHA